MAWRLVREEGYLVGISAAAAMVGALRIADELTECDQPATIVTIFPDNAYKYLSESFWTNYGHRATHSISGSTSER
ncbi:MAG TPA: hypothetical protein VMT24_11845 [Aggregatilineaceae bacterium]|nr:hypothetical protein [Aggregatilineaceae bacterium]